MPSTSSQKHVLIVDWETASAEPLRQELIAAGFIVRAVTDRTAVLGDLSSRPPHLVLVDWNMPGMLALEIINHVRAVRAGHRIRVIILSMVTSEQEVIAALSSGADDFVAKPYSQRELVARAQAVLRCQSREMPRIVLSCDELELDSRLHRVMIRGELIGVRGVEYRLLEFLMSNPGRTFERRQLLARLWDRNGATDERTVDVAVQRLRRILSGYGYDAHVQTIRGFGYRFALPTPGPAPVQVSSG